MPCQRAIVGRLPPHEATVTCLLHEATVTCLLHEVPCVPDISPPSPDATRIQYVYSAVLVNGAATTGKSFNRSCYLRSLSRRGGA